MKPQDSPVTTVLIYNGDNLLFNDFLKIVPTIGEEIVIPNTNTPIYKVKDVLHYIGVLEHKIVIYIE